MRLSSLYILLVFGICSCGQKSQEQEVSFQVEHLMGAWRLADSHQCFYPLIEFGEDSMITLFCCADTLYRYRFGLNGRILLIRGNAHSFNNAANPARFHILRLDSDTLMLDKLFEQDKAQVYTKYKSKN